MKSRRLLIKAIVAMAVASLVTSWWWLGYRVNVSSSLPLGIYKLDQKRPEIGDLVAFCVPDRLAHMDVFSHLTVDPCYGGGHGIPLLKRVVETQQDGLLLIVKGESERSVDSRVFGPIRRDEIIAAVSAVYVF